MCNAHCLKLMILPRFLLRLVVYSTLVLVLIFERAIRPSFARDFSFCNVRELSITARCASFEPDESRTRAYLLLLMYWVESYRLPSKSILSNDDPEELEETLRRCL